MDKIYLTTIEGFNPDETLELDTKIKFIFSNGKILTGTVRPGFVNIDCDYNRVVFIELGIETPMEFVKKAAHLDHDLSGDWPKTDTQEQLRDVLIALLKYNKPLSSSSTMTSTTIIKVKHKKSTKLNFKL